MRRLILALMIMVTGVCAATADQQTFFAGFIHVTVQDVEPFDATVWYPTKASEAPFKAGPFVIAAARGAEIAEGAPFPAVLLSHGRRGSPLGHRDLAAHLARDGFIVIAPTHVGDTSGELHASPRPQQQILVDRPRQARLAIDRILSDRRFSEKIDATRIGAIGFSAGGYTVLALGAVDSKDSNFARSMIQDCFLGGSLGFNGSSGAER